MENTYFQRINASKTKAKRETVAFLINYSKATHVVKSPEHKFEVTLN